MPTTSGPPPCPRLRRHGWDLLNDDRLLSFLNRMWVMRWIACWSLPPSYVVVVVVVRWLVDESGGAKTGTTGPVSHVIYTERMDHSAPGHMRPIPVSPKRKRQCEAGYVPRARVAYRISA